MAFEKSSAFSNRPLLQNGIAEGAVEDVSRSSGIDAIHDECRRIDVLRHPPARALRRRPASSPPLAFRTGSESVEGFEMILLAGPARGKFGTGDQVIDIWQHLSKPG